MFKLTKPQRAAVARKYQHNPDGAANYREFRRRVRPSLGYIMLPWCGMYVGIEPDGYSHT